MSLITDLRKQLAQISRAQNEPDAIKSHDVFEKLEKEYGEVEQQLARALKAQEREASLGRRADAHAEAESQDDTQAYEGLAPETEFAGDGARLSARRLRHRRRL